MSSPSSQFVSPSLSPPCPHAHSLHLHLCSCPANRFVCTFFFKVPHICVDMQYLFFSFWLTSLCMTDSRSIHISINDPIFPFYGWVKFHCIYIPNLLHPFICWWTFRLLPCSDIVSNAAVNTGVHVSFGIFIRGTILISWSTCEIINVIIIISSSSSNF